MFHRLEDDKKNRYDMRPFEKRLPMNAQRDRRPRVHRCKRRNRIDYTRRNIDDVAGLRDCIKAQQAEVCTALINPFTLIIGVQFRL